MVLQDIRVEICGLVAHGPCGGGLGGARGAGALPGRSGAQDLVLGGNLLEVALEAFVFDAGLLLGGFEGGEFGFEVFDVFFFSLPESALPAVVSG